MNEFARGYEEALSDVSEWLRETSEEWYALKVVDAHQALAIKELIHSFDLGYLYDRRKLDDGDETHS